MPLGTRVRESRLRFRRWLRRRWPAVGLALVIAWGLVQTASGLWYDLFEKRVQVVEPGCLVRGAWQRPGPLRRVLARERIKTIVTMATVDENLPRYFEQAAVAQEAGVRWIFVPMVCSTATHEQMAEAADLLADRSLQPILFHCVAGHHRTSLAQAAYRIRHEGWTAERAWRELAALPWTDPADLPDRRLIEAFAAREGRYSPSGDSFTWEEWLETSPRAPGNALAAARGTLARRPMIK
jgi:protein tyrosine phosphatase (PTP) superfamily phosphohydrolase (DUF442 family)